MGFSRKRKNRIHTGALGFLFMSLLVCPCFAQTASGESSFFASHRQALIPCILIGLILVAMIIFVLRRERKNQIIMKKESALLQRDREREAMLENLMKNIPGGVVIYRVGSVNKTLFVSDGAAALVGRTAEEFEQWSSGDIVANTTYEDDVPRINEIIDAAVAAGAPIEAGFRMKHKSGRLVWVQLSSVKIREEEGDSVYYAVFTKMPEESVLYKHITDDASTGVYVCDAETLEMIYANDVLQQLLGDGEYKGKKCYEYTSGLTSPCQRCLRDEMSEKCYATREAYADRADRYIALKGHLGNYGGRSVIITYTTDITDIHNQIIEQENRLENALQQAQSANDAKTNFLSQMSHDMRTPMNAIIGLTALAKDKVSEPVIMNDYLDKIRGSAGFLLGLVNDCLDMEKISQGKMTLHPAAYSYRDFIKNMTTMMEPLCSKKNISFSIQHREERNTIVVDRLRFEQVFYNLLSNAVKFTPEGGKIEILYRNEATTDEYVEMDYVVKDNGCGMSKEFQSRMFNPFEQDEGGGERHQGTGLGLSIVKSIVDMMDGTISVNSAPGEGTEIIVRLKTPRLPEEQETEEYIEINAEYDEILTGKNILIVEDNLVNCEIAKTLLENKNAVITVAENGRQALDIFMSSPSYGFDAILMDIRMPVMDGLAAAKEIRALPRPDAKTVPIIAMTANAFAEDMALSLAAGMNDHLTKPFEPEIMYEMIARQIEASA